MLKLLSLIGQGLSLPVFAFIRSGQEQEKKEKKAMTGKKSKDRNKKSRIGKARTNEDKKYPLPIYKRFILLEYFKSSIKTSYLLFKGDQ